MADHQPAFPSGASETAPAQSAPAARPLRWVVPLLLFFVIIGGIAWLVQNMPSWRGRTVEPAPVAKGPEVLLTIGTIHNRGVYLALWERMPEEKSTQKQLYAREFERDAEGQYHFPFQVHPEQPAEVGVTNKSCDCSRLYVALVSEAECRKLFDSIKTDPSQEVKENPDWVWKSLENSKEHGIALPAGAYGILRMTWNNKRAPGDSLNLGAHIWARTSSVASKQDYGLKIDAVSSQPLRTKKDRVDVGVIEKGGKGKAEFLVWSPTRADAKFELPKDDPLFEMAVKEFTPAECAALQVKLRQEEFNTRVRAAWTITVTVHEQKSKNQLDQGYFMRVLKIDLPVAVEDLPPLVITGTVKSDIRVGAVNDQGRINLQSFPAQYGTKKTFVLSTETNTELDLANIQHPAGLKVQLTEMAKRKWALNVEVPPNRFFGPITEDNVVILRTKAGRSIRIPLMGHAVQG